MNMIDIIHERAEAHTKMLARAQDVVEVIHAHDPECAVFPITSHSDVIDVNVLSNHIIEIELQDSYLDVPFTITIPFTAFVNGSGDDTKLKEWAVGKVVIGYVNELRQYTNVRDTIIHNFGELPDTGDWDLLLEMAMKRYNEEMGNAR